MSNRITLTNGKKEKLTGSRKKDHIKTVTDSRKVTKFEHAPLRSLQAYL